MESTKPKLLLVDDEPTNLHILRGIFAADYELSFATDGASAVELATSAPPDLVILDVMMPDMDGFEACQRMRGIAALHNVPVIFLTALADSDNECKGLNHGAQDYLTKPVNAQIAMLRVRNLIEKAQLTAQLHVQNEALNALNASLEAQVRERTAGLSQANEQLGKTYLSIIKAFSSMVELRVPHLAGHGRRVADLVQKMAESMRLDKEEVRRLIVSSLIHDLGFLVLPDTITTKAVEMLGSESLENYQRHPVVGATSLASMGKELEQVARIIRSHHERYDGLGYPDKLKGDAIPLGARMLALADTFDDLTNGHLTGTRLTPQRALKLMEDGRGTQFDPALLDVFKLALEGTTLDTDHVFALRTHQLVEGMVLNKPIASRQGITLLAPEQALTLMLIEKIKFYEKETGVNLLVFVRQPAAADQGVAA